MAASPLPSSSATPPSSPLQRGDSSGGLKQVLGIRREDKSRWERRCPLTPQHVRQLISRGFKVHVQPSDLRIFADDEFEQAGATMSEDLSVCDVILGVKEPSTFKLLPNRTYIFFSHTIKAQAYNMPMLDDILNKNIRLIDYEKIVDANNQRLVRFGKYAGFAGLIDGLRQLGERLLMLGYSTPFLNVGYSHMYSRLADAKHAVMLLGEEIRRVGLPRAICPLVFTFTGASGEVSKGGLEIFRLLPHEDITVDGLQKLVKPYRRPHGSMEDLQSAEADHEMAMNQQRHQLYLLCISSKDVMVRADGKPYEKTDYYANPSQYVCNFAERVAPHTSVIVNCTYWDQRFPRFLSLKEMKYLKKTNKTKSRLMFLLDISCDVKGSIEFLSHTTTIDRPTYTYDVDSGQFRDGIEGRGILVSAVDNLPTELPLEASQYFSNALLPFLPSLLAVDGTKSYEEQVAELPREWTSAIITAHGELTPPFKYIAKLRAQNESGQRRIVLLGSGMVAQPIVDYLLREDKIVLTVASNILAQAQQLLVKHSKESTVSAVLLDVDNEEQTRALIQRHDLVLSLVPPVLHVKIAKLCIECKVNMITASYISPAMKELDAAAKEAGISIFNEIGLDPGIDHLSAMSVINDAKKKGGKIISFESSCGGLPAPEAADNPFAYKFSWNPRGALLAGMNPAKFIRDGKTIEVPGDKCYGSAVPMQIEPCFSVEVLPNRDCTPYRELYGIETTTTMFRGTIRYLGWGLVMNSLLALGLLDATPFPFSHNRVTTWPLFLRDLLKVSPAADLRESILKKLNLNEKINAVECSRVLAALDFLELFDDESEVVVKGSPLDLIAELLEKNLQFGPGERDMILMHHRFVIDYPDGTETITSTMIEYGSNNTGGYTAMAKTVGTPVAIAALMVLNGQVTRKGVFAPLTPDLYEPLLAALKDEGIQCRENAVWKPKA